ncbi:serine carboxypeptidase-like 20 [Manihot esculenta]|uniref:Uncharacterized protein n=1 Tax=Manihot esculenta TaxID=3983 RepID=A0A2C9UTG0_MANES|nr:serine carboxypeptidase-like 20 [Manihot esculenta]OAY34232.1 hypothetical protein MANES_12G004801v8 [Manihot esculenta]
MQVLALEVRFRITRTLPPKDIEHLHIVETMICVPFTGTQAWTRSLGYKIVDEWRSWISNDQVARYLQGYDDNFTFLTIKGYNSRIQAKRIIELL